MAQLGQDTGKEDRIENGYEARKLLKMISEAGRSAVLEHCGMQAVRFVAEEVERSNATVTHYGVSGKQLFWLRDIKDRLVEAGKL